MSALRDWFRRRPCSAEFPQPYHPAVADQHACSSPPQEGSWVHWGYPMPTQYNNAPNHAPTPSFDTASPFSDAACMRQILWKVAKCTQVYFGQTSVFHNIILSLTSLVYPDVGCPQCYHVALCVAILVMPCNLPCLRSESTLPDTTCNNAGHGGGAVRERQRG